MPSNSRSTSSECRTSPAGRGLVASLVVVVLGLGLAAGATPSVAGAAEEPCDVIAWWGRGDGGTMVFVAAADGTNRFEFSAGGWPVWSPDATRIAWSDGGELWVGDADGGSPLAISQVDTGPDPVGLSGPAAWSPDGNRIAWSGYDGTQWHIYVSNTDGTDRSIISDVGPDPAPILNRRPTWSHDGMLIAWYGTDGTDWHVYVAENDGTDRRVASDVASGPGITRAMNPAWSPVENRLAWGFVDDESYQVWAVDADGTNPTQVLRSTEYAGGGLRQPSSPQWSPDGARLLWDGQDTFTRQLWVADADGSMLSKITPEGYGAPRSNREPQWSPDGTRVAWVGHDSTDEIYVADADGAGIHSIVDAGLGLDPSGNSGAVWRPRTTDGNDALCAPVDCPDSPVQVFTDVASSSFAFDDVACIHHLEVTTGTGPETYSPEQAVTREQMAAFLARVWRNLGNPCPTDHHSFTDVLDTSFADDDIACILGLEITTGTSPTTYHPARSVTREEMAAFLARLWRTLGHACPTEPHPFADVPDSSFADDDIACILGLEITTGTSPTTYHPDRSVTREEMAAFLARLVRANAS